MPTGIYKHYPHQGFQKGHVHTEERRRKMSEAHKGKIISKETRKKMSLAKQGSKCYLYIDGRSKDKKYIYWLNNRYYFRKRSAFGSHTFGEWQTLKAQYNFTCPSCHKAEPEVKLTEDHIIPLSKGGSNNIENVQPLCGSCNCKKFTKIIKYVA